VFRRLELIVVCSRVERGGSVNPGKSARQRGNARIGIALMTQIGAKLGAAASRRRPVNA
jgi:hypothetical protein